MFSDRTSGRGREEPAQELTDSELHRFLTDVGYARHQLKDLYCSLQRINAQQENGEAPDPKRIDATVRHFTAALRGLLEPWDRKPVFGNGVELRLVNESCGLCAGEYSPEILLRSIKRTGSLSPALKDVQVAERRLTEIYRALSGDEGNPTMIRGKVD